MVLLLGRKQSSRRRCRCKPDKSRFRRWSSGSRSGESGRVTHAGPPGQPATDNFFVWEELGLGGGWEGTVTLSPGRRLRWGNGSLARRRGWARESSGRGGRLGGASGRAG